MGENITNVCTSSSFGVYGGIVELRHFAKCKIKIVKQQSVGLGNVVTFFSKSNLLWPPHYSSAEGFELMKQFMPSLFLPAISNH